MACKKCEEQDNYNCDCGNDNCNCATKLSTVCSVYEGVKLTILDTYEGQDLESILKKVDFLFTDIFDILQSRTYTSIGEGADVFKRVNGLNQAEFRSILSSDSVNILENLEDIGVSINETWLEDFILNVDAETTTNITETVTGKKIAKYTNEDGVSQNINETITTFINNGNGSFTYTNELGATTTLNISTLQTLTTIINTVQGKRIATYTNELGNVVDIKETITSMLLQGDSSFQYTNENGVSLSYRPQDATTSVKGLSEAATQTETNTGTDALRYVTPQTLSGRTANDTRSGVIETATQAEANALSSTSLALTPGRLPKATTTQEGIVRFATQAERDAGTATNVIMSPSDVNAVVNPNGGSVTGATGIFLAKGKIILGDAIGTANNGQSLVTTGDYTSCTVLDTQPKDLLIRVNFSNVGTTNYQPIMTVISKGANYNNDNDIITIARNFSTTSIQIALREIQGGIQNIDLQLSLLKL